MSTVHRSSIFEPKLPLVHEVKFQWNDKRELLVEIKAKDILLRSVQSGDTPYSARIYTDPRVMQSYGDGQPKTEHEVEAKLKNVWVANLKRNNPLCPLYIFHGQTYEVMGQVGLRRQRTSAYGVQPATYEPGVAEFYVLIRPEFWMKGYGFQSAVAIIHGLGRSIIRHKYLIEGQPLKKIVAQAYDSNVGGRKILSKIGMRLVMKRESLSGEIPDKEVYYFEIEADKIGNFQRPSQKQVEEAKRPATPPTPKIEAFMQDDD